MASIVRRDGKRGPTYRVLYRNPQGRSQSKTFKRKADARAFVAQVEHTKNRGEYIGPEGGKTRFGDLASRVMDARRLSLRASTVARDESYMRSIILPTFRDYPLASITPAGVQNWVTETATTHSPATTRKAYQLLGSVLSAAVDHELIARIPCRGIKLPKLDQDEVRFLNPNEIARLADAIDTRFGPLVLVGAYAGLRFGEAVGLRIGPDSLDLMRRRITIAVQLSEVRGHVEFTEPKTRSARRVIALPEFLVAELSRFVESRSPGDLIFQAAEGGPVRRTNFRRRYWLPAIGAAKLSGLRYHDLRHTHVALLIAAGEHPSTIASRLGHSSVKTVLDVYGHLLPGTDEAAADRIDAMVTAQR